jgi:hypothetical protein
MLQSFRIPVSLLFILAAHLGLSAAGFADSRSSLLAPNASVGGNVTGLIQVGQQIPEMECHNSRCSFAINPLQLALKVPGQAALQVKLTEARFPRNVKRFRDGVEVNDLVSRPVLLSGTATVRHAAEDGRSKVIPVAATLFRDSTGHFITISLPKVRRVGRSSGQSIVSVRAPLNSAYPSGALAARATQASSSAFKGLVCGTEETRSNRSLAPLVSSATERAVSIQAFKVVYLITDFDSQFATKGGCSGATCNNLILSYVNASSVIYQNQLDLAFEISTQFGPTTQLGSTTRSTTLLENFKNLNNASRSSARGDLYQLYTGKDLDSNVIGLAYVGTTCSNRRFAAMLVQYVSEAINPSTVAHEIGHTLGADHPSSDEGGIMDPSVRFPLPTTFSTRSVGQMAPFISANYARCIGGSSLGSTPTPTRTPTTEPSGTATPTPGPGTPTITPVPGTAPTPPAIATATPTRTASGGNSVGSGVPRTIDLSAKISNRGAVSISASVSALEDCTLTLSAAGSEVTADPGTILASLTPTTLTTNFTATLPLRLKANSGPEIIFFAYRTCGGEVKEVSKFAGIKPSKVAAKLSPTKKRSFKLVSKTAWINQLTAALLVSR